MTSRLEGFQKTVADSGASLASRSLNQEAVKRQIDGERRICGAMGESRKVERARIRRERRAASTTEETSVLMRSFYVRI